MLESLLTLFLPTIGWGRKLSQKDAEVLMYRVLARRTRMVIYLFIVKVSVTLR